MDLNIFTLSFFKVSHFLNLKTLTIDFDVGYRSFFDLKQISKKAKECLKTCIVFLIIPHAIFSHKKFSENDKITNMDEDIEVVEILAK